MKTCASLVGEGCFVELWVPRRQNAQYSSIDPYIYHHVDKVFHIRKLPVIDIMSILPGRVGFYLMLFSWNISVLFSSYFVRGAVYFAHDFRDVQLLLFRKIHIFFEIHDFYRSSIDLLNRRALRRSMGLIVTNRIKIADLVKRYGFPASKMLHAPNAVNVSQFNPQMTQAEARATLGLPSDRKIALYAGHLFSWKGVDTLIPASVLLSETASVYVIGGTDTDIALYKEKAGQMHAPIHIEGRKQHSEVPIWLRAADILILPNTAKEESSRLETSPVKLFEYLASGTPVVASDIPSIHNVVSEQEVNFFEADNSEDLALVISRVLQALDAAKKKAADAQNLVRQYSWERRAKLLVEFMREQLA